MDILDFLATNGYTLELFVEFCFFGIGMNVLMGLISFIFTVFKVASLDEESLKQYIAFGEFRRGFIFTYNSPLKRLCNALLLFLPLHGAIVNVVYLWYMITYAGINGVIKAYMAADTSSIVQLVKYQVVKIDDDGNESIDK